MLVPSKPLLSPVLLVKALVSKERHSPLGRLQLFSRGRYALTSYLQRSGQGVGVFYMPSYICTDAVEPLVRHGQKVRFYPVTDSLEPDWDWLDGQVGDDTFGLLLVHYFGFPNALDRALKFCRIKRIALIEDCAHSFLTRHDGKPIGTLGDAGFYSFYKVLPVPDGAGLVVRDPTVTNDSEPRDESGRKASVGPAFRELVKFGVYESGIGRSLLSRHRGWNGSAEASQAESANVGPWGISTISRRILMTIVSDCDDLKTRRQENYRSLLDAFAEFPEVAPIFTDLSDSVCPYAFPVVIEDRDRVVSSLWAMGIPAYRWPDLPHAVLSNPVCTMTSHYASRVMVLPIHQGLNARHIEYMVDAYRTIRAT